MTAPTELVLRPELHAFAQEMERHLRRHDDGRGDSWRGCDDEWLFDRLREEMDELAAVLVRRGNSRNARVIHEAADVANFAMFLAAQARADAIEEAT